MLKNWNIYNCKGIILNNYAQNYIINYNYNY